MENKTNTRIIAVTSGKGGVGKTNISAGTAIALAEEGRRVCLFDADLGLANINILLGLIPDYTLEDLMSGGKTLDQILIKNYNGIDIIPGSSGVEGIANLNDNDVGRLIETLASLKEYDFLIFDTSAGIAAPVIAFCMAASEVLIVITPEPTSLTDAYALLKVLLANGFKGSAKIVVNQCRSIDHGKMIFQKFGEAVATHLNRKINLTGIILSDPNLTCAVREQKVFLSLFPDSKASKCVRHLARTLLSKAPEEGLNRDFSDLWEQCFNIIKSPLSIKGTGRKNQESARIDEGKTEEEQRNKKTAEPALLDNGENKYSAINVKEVDSSHRDGVKDRLDDSGASTDNEVPVLIRELIRSVTAVSEELRMMRESTGKEQVISVPKSLSQQAIEPVRNNNAFILDFEEYKNKHHG